MLHELYLRFFRVNPLVINQFHEIDKLFNIGLIILRSLNQTKRQVKKYSRGDTSPLFNSNECSIDYIINLAESNDTDKQELFSKLDHAINNLLNDPQYSSAVTIFLQANQTSISSISRNSGINRVYLTKEYNKGLKQLKKQLNET